MSDYGKWVRPGPYPNNPTGRTPESPGAAPPLAVGDRVKLKRFAAKTRGDLRGLVLDLYWEDAGPDLGWWLHVRVDGQPGFERDSPWAWERLDPVEALALLASVTRRVGRSPK